MKNYEKFKDEIIEILDNHLAIDKDTGKPIECDQIDCNDCMLKNVSHCLGRTKKWLFEEAKEPIELTQFEYDLLNCLNDEWEFNEFYILNDLKIKGHFKDVKDTSMTIREILKNCVVKEDE